MNEPTPEERAAGDAAVQRPIPATRIDTVDIQRRHRWAGRGTAFTAYVEVPEPWTYSEMLDASPEVWKATRRRVIKRMREHLLEALTAQGYDVLGSELRFSKNAGCSTCPCSPGFKIPDRIGGSVRITTVPAELNAAEAEVWKRISRTHPTTDLQDQITAARGIAA